MQRLLGDSGSPRQNLPKKEPLSISTEGPNNTHENYSVSPEPYTATLNGVGVDDHKLSYSLLPEKFYIVNYYFCKSSGSQA